MDFLDLSVPESQRALAARLADESIKRILDLGIPRDLVLDTWSAWAVGQIMADRGAAEALAHVRVLVELIVDGERARIAAGEAAKP